MAELPRLAAESLAGPALTAVGIGAGTIILMVLWKRLPAKAQLLPGPLVAVAAATLTTVALDLPVDRVELSGLPHAVQPPKLAGAGQLATVGFVITIVAFTLIASAESLSSAAAVDRLHDGPTTDYDKELMAQGAGNTVCGLLGALPMTAVIVRSAANAQSWARTKASRVLHGVWLLLFAALLPGALGLIPTPALGGVLIHVGRKLLPVKELVSMWRDHRGEAVVLVVTAAAILVTNMFEGVVIGLLLAMAKTAWDTSHVHIEVKDQHAGQVRVRITGNATFLRLPRILDALEQLPAHRPVQLDLGGLRHLDHA